jgi:hypothetical protein
LKTFTNSGDFTGSRIRISNSGGNSKRIGNLNSVFEKADSQSSVCDLKTNAKTRLNFFFTIISGLRNNLGNHWRLLECRNKHFEEDFSMDLQN